MRNRASNEWNILESRMEEELGKGEAAGGEGEHEEGQWGSEQLRPECSNGSCL